VLCGGVASQKGIDVVGAQPFFDESDEEEEGAAEFVRDAVGRIVVEDGVERGGTWKRWVELDRERSLWR